MSHISLLANGVSVLPKKNKEKKRTKVGFPGKVQLNKSGVSGKVQLGLQWIYLV